MALLDRLSRLPRSRNARRVGITGAPGAGKSTLLNALIDALREQDQKIGVIAVDPSSQRSGGALLGDRMRLGTSAREQGVFLRSMAARNRLGGLADATWAGAAVMAAVFDWVFIETVGVGQSEGEVARIVDSLVFVAQPGAGDMLQFMKAGILELPDLFVVNKSDIGPSARRTRSELIAGLDLGTALANQEWVPPVLLASARDRAGLDELVDRLVSHRNHLEKGDQLGRRRQAGAVRFATDSLLRRYGEFGLSRLGGFSQIERRLNENSDRSPFRGVLEVGQEIERALAGD